MELFKRTTWNEFQQLTDDDYNCRVLYITDKNMHRVRYESSMGAVYVLYNGQYGTCDYSYQDLMNMPDVMQELQPGLYILNDKKLYYYDGSVLTLISGASSGGNTTKSFTIWSTHTSFNDANYARRSDAGNLQIQGYIEGQIDCGEWK